MIYIPIGKRVLETCKRQPVYRYMPASPPQILTDSEPTGHQAGKRLAGSPVSFYSLLPFSFPPFLRVQAQKAAAEKKAWRLQLFKARRRHPRAISGTQSCSEAREEETGRRAFNPLINDPMQVQTGSAAWRGSQETSENKPKTCHRSQVLNGNQQYFCWNID